MTYLYSGPVYYYDRITDEHWSASTEAASEKKALQNLKYRFSREAGLAYPAGIRLDTKSIRLIENKSRNNVVRNNTPAVVSEPVFQQISLAI